MFFIHKVFNSCLFLVVSLDHGIDIDGCVIGTVNDPVCKIAMASDTSTHPRVCDLEYDGRKPGARDDGYFPNSFLEVLEIGYETSLFSLRELFF